MSPPLQAPDYKHVTEECLREWKGQSAAAFRVPDPVPMARFLYELCWAVVRGDLPPQKCRLALDSVEFVEESRRGEVGSVLADIIAHLGQDVTISGEYRNRLVKMTKSFVELSLIVPRLLQERCEEEFLWEVEQSKSKGQDLKAKEVRVNTRLLYQQTKFNLLREESEGYAKLVTLLCQIGSDLACQNSSSVTTSIIKSLIGHFDLDPNRVFDIVLECFELYPDNAIFYQLIPLFPKSHAAQILGFKFQYYQRLDVNSPVPSGLFRIAALLVKSGLIDLDSLYAHLLPNDDEAFEHFDSFVARRIDEASKIGKINLAATGKDLMDDEKQEITIDLYTALEMENDIVEERALEIEKNQKLGLLLGFLSVHDWDHAQLLFERLAHLNPVEHIEICEGLFRIIERTISPAYDIIFQTYYKMDTTPSSSQTFSVDLPKEFFQMLSTCGPYLHRDTQLFQKVCRVLKAYYLLSKESNHTTGVVSLDSQIEEALGSCLLPSLQLIPANPAVDMEIWGVLSLLPYEARYRMYGEWEKDTEQNPIVLAARQTAKLDTRRLLKRLAKENLKQLGRMVAKLAHANPMTVLRTIIQQVEAYRDMITPVVDAFKYLTQLEFDILQYIVIERLAQGGREKLKDDGLNLSDWLQCLASFWGHLCKKHHSVELKSLFQYLVNQLKKGSGIELVVLEELIQQMANVQYTENMTEEQVDAMAGSETLRLQASLFGSTRNYKVLNKSINKLRDSLLPKEEPKLAIPLLLLIAQHRSKIIINADATYIKMVSEHFDRCHGILLQYVEFLSSAVTATTYVQLMPPLEDLIHKYHIEAEVAFLMYRPVMRLFKSTNGGDTCWPLDDNEEGESVSCDDLILHFDTPHKSIMWSDLLSTIRATLPEKAWNGLSPALYATFWGLTLYDLHFPKDRYDAEIKKLHENLKQLEDNSDNSSIAISRRKKDKERIQDLLDRLNNESQKHQQHIASVHQRLAREKDKWLSSSPDALKINMEFLQRCIYPRCVFSMQDAVYCAMFVQTLHLLETPFFNTVNHIDAIICKTLQPIICCGTEYEAGRLGRFLYETLKMAYYWKSDESVYERECGNKPGFAVFFRNPNSQRLPYIHFIKLHWKWSSRMTKVLNQCMESKEYMEIRNALIVLTKISSIFPVIRKSGVNLEKRVAKLKGDEREDLKVLATGVAAALAARKSSWLSEEEFGKGHLDVKKGLAKTVPGNQSTDSLTAKDQSVRAKSIEGRHERSEGAMKPDAQQKKNALPAAVSDNQIPSSSAQGKVSGVIRGSDEPPKLLSEEVVRVSKPTAESETRAQQKRVAHVAGKVSKHDTVKEDAKSGKSSSRGVNQQGSSVPVDKEVLSQAADGVQDTTTNSLAASNGNLHTAPRKVSSSSQRSTVLATYTGGAANPSGESTDLIDSNMKHQKRSAPADEQERGSKRRKGEIEGRDGDFTEHHTDKEKNVDSRLVDKFRPLDHDKSASDEQILSRAEKSKEKFDDKYDRDAREKADRAERRRGEDIVERSTDRSLDRREHSIERTQERGTDRAPDKGREDKNKEERNKVKHAEPSIDRAHPSDERFRGQSLPPPPPLPTSFVPQSVGANRRDEDNDRRSGSARHNQRSSPRRDDKERWHLEESAVSLQDDGKHRREEDLRDRKRDDRDVSSSKVDDRDRDKGNIVKEDSDPNSASKRRKIKRDQSALEAGEYMPSVPQHPGSSQLFETRERERKGGMSQHRASHADDLPRMHGKDSTSKTSRREADQVHEREWEEEKRPRTETKRKHRK